MPKNLNPKCWHCATLNSKQARLLHGPSGDGCWTGTNCHSKRAYYRKLQSDRVGDAIELEVQPVEQWYAVLYLYRDGKDSPLHALGAGLWFGQEERYRLKPIHCFGMTQKKIQDYTVKVLEAFGEQCETPLRGYKEMFDVDPHRCPIRPCPFYID